MSAVVDQRLLERDQQLLGQSGRVIAFDKGLDDLALARDVPFGLADVSRDHLQLGFVVTHVTP
jgi:hypothetical protein